MKEDEHGDSILMKAFRHNGLSTTVTIDKAF